MKALVLLGGGVDSTVCLAKMVDRFGSNEVMALSFDYGQKHRRELDSCKKISDFYGVELVIKDLSDFFENDSSALLEGSSEDVPKVEYSKQKEVIEGAPAKAYVPFRNGLFVSAGVPLAMARGCDYLVYGISDSTSVKNAYPDACAFFNSSISDTVSIGSGGCLRLVAPFINETKARIILDGKRLGVPFAYTWTCHLGGKRACGVCGSCISRLKAFKEAGVPDPIEYED